MAKIRLKSIKCSVPDESDKDEMYLKLNREKIWPEGSKYFRMDVDDTVYLDFDLDVPEGWVELELWDYDFVSANDHLGTFKFKVDAEYGKFSTSMTPNRKETKRASYYMEWERV